MSQAEWILGALQRGPVTAMDALQGCGCFRLAARIQELRSAGHRIDTQMLDMPNGKHIAQYRLMPDPAARN